MISILNRPLLLKRSLTSLVAFALLGYLHGKVVAAPLDLVAGQRMATIQHSPPPFTDKAIVVRKALPDPLPEAQPVSAATIAHGSHHLQRVSFAAVVLGANLGPEPGTFELSLQLENHWIAARGRGLPAGTRLPATGSRIQVQGVLDQRVWPDSGDSSFGIHLAGPSDWLLLAAPPRDYTRPWLWSISLIAVAASLTLVWTSLITDTPSEALVRFAVQDTSPGIAPEIAATLFQPFTQADASITRRHGGTGLGLAICKSLTTAMGGTLGVKSTPGHGSTFWVELPFPRTSEAEKADRPTEGANAENPAGPAGLAHSAHAAHDEMHPVAGEELAGEPPRLWGCSVLVVDDQPIHLELAGWVLRQQGAIPTLMSDAREALERLGQEPDRFDAVLMDGQMPGLSEWEAIRRIRSHPRLQQLPVIAFTAAVLPSEQKAAREAGAHDVVPKPVDVELLVAVLQRWIRPGAAPVASGATAAAPTATAALQIAAGHFRPVPRVAGLNTEHAAQQLRHDADLFLSLLATFRHEFAPLTAQLHDDLQHGRYDQASSRLHALLGIAGSLGAIELAQTARDLQTALHTKEATHITVPMARFTTTLNTLLSAISES